jgi:hypothetical protein
MLGESATRPIRHITAMRVTILRLIAISVTYERKAFVMKYVRIPAMIAVMVMGATSPALAQAINFGDDRSQWANDGECDDGRFTGAGLTSTPLLQEDVLGDATDCRNAYKAGRLTLLGVASDGRIDFGNDSGEWANDGECDDMRFAGPGMTQTPLLQDDIMRDATDCREGYSAGRLKLAGQ